MNSIRNWKVFFALSLILPFSLFASFRLIGATHGPSAISESIIAGTVNWNLTRPTPYMGDRIQMNKTVDGIYDNDGVYVAVNITKLEYFKRFNFAPALGKDFFSMFISAYSNISSGYVYSATVTLLGKGASESIEIDRNPPVAILSNLQLASINYSSVSDGEASIVGTGLGHAKSCSLEFNPWWILGSENTNYNETAYVKIVFFNGTTFNQVSLPLNGVVLPY